MTPKTRISLDLTPTDYKMVERLQLAMDEDSKASILRRSIRIIHYLATRFEEGAALVIVGPDGKHTEIALPVFISQSRHDIVGTVLSSRGGGK